MNLCTLSFLLASYNFLFGVFYLNLHTVHSLVAAFLTRSHRTWLCSSYSLQQTVGDPNKHFTLIWNASEQRSHLQKINELAGNMIIVVTALNACIADCLRLT